MYNTGRADERIIYDDGSLSAHQPRICHRAHRSPAADAIEPGQYKNAVHHTARFYPHRVSSYGIDPSNSSVLFHFILLRLFFFFFFFSFISFFFLLQLYFIFFFWFSVDFLKFSAALPHSRRQSLSRALAAWNAVDALRSNYISQRKKRIRRK